MIVDGAPLWLIVATGLALNLRFVIFSAAIAPSFAGIGTPMRWFTGHFLTDGSFACCYEPMRNASDPHWRLGYYLATGLWSWLLWQGFALIDIHAAHLLPKTWSLEFMATIALIVLLVPMAKVRAPDAGRGAGRRRQRDAAAQHAAAPRRRHRHLHRHCRRLCRRTGRRKG